MLCVVKITAKRALVLLLTQNEIPFQRRTADKLKQIDFAFSIYRCFALMHTRL